MTYDEQLADRIRDVLDAEPGIGERRMFGGLAFLVGGHLAVAASGRGGLMVRVDPAETERLVRTPGVDRMVMRGREMDGWLRVRPDVVADDAGLRDWCERGVAFAASLPARRPAG